MKMTFDKLVEELQGRSAEELIDLAELARHYAVEHRRAEILANARLSEDEYRNGKLPKPSSDVDELMRKLQHDESSPDE